MKKTFDCKCSTQEHTISFNINKYDGKFEAYISCYLNVYQGFFTRCWLAIKYVFKHYSVNGMFDCFLIKDEDVQQYIDLFECIRDNQNPESPATITIKCTKLEIEQWLKLKNNMEPKL